MLSESTFDKFKYILYKPPDVSNPALVVVLHGSGEIGSDLSKLKKREPYLALSKGTCAPNAVVLMPQLPKGTWGDYKASLKALIDHVAEEQGCDMKRVSITGHSLGANGTLDMLLAYPDYFSAASVLSPCKDIGDKMKQIAHVPVWFLAGEKEHNYKKYAQSMHNRLKGLGGETKLTLVPGVGHPIQFTWTSDKYQMFDWLASYRLDRFIVDVSKHQGKINWDRLAPHLAFCIIKASGLYGNGSDPYYAYNVESAVAHGVSFHSYHFLYCVTEVQAKRDAKLFFDTVKAAGKWPLFWVLDCESQWGIKDNQAAPIARIFEDELRRLAKEQGPGDIRVALYVAQEKYNDWTFDYDHYDYLWIPGYGDKYKPPMPCDMWQYSSKGTLPGISGDVDLNKLMGTKPMSFFVTETDPTDEKTDGGEAIMFTGKQLAAYCEKMYANKSHWAYWYGTYGNKCTLSKYESKSKQYSYPKYSHYAPSRKSGYMKDIEHGRRCADCVGMIKSFFWTGNQYDTDPKYGANGCPDKSANGMIDLCKVTGAISTIPDIPGVVVWTNGHIGVYIGGGYTIEMRGFDYDCVKRKVKDGPWKKWGKLPMLSYDEAPEPEPVPKPTKLGDRDLKKGCEGADVKELQNGLMKLGYALPNYGADGDYGSETEKAVKQFQLAHSLPDDGVMNVGSDYDTLFKALNVDPQDYGNVKITGGSVNIRSAPGYDSKVYGTAHKGDILPYQGVTQEAEGKPWYLVIWKNQNAWVSSKYARLVK